MGSRDLTEYEFPALTEAGEAELVAAIQRVDRALAEHKAQVGRLRVRMEAQDRCVSLSGLRRILVRCRSGDPDRWWSAGEIIDELVTLKEDARRTVADSLVYFCGVWPGTRAGHCCRPRQGPQTPWGGRPGYPLLDWHPERDGIRTPRAGWQWRRGRPPEVEGVFTRLVVDGWTLLAAWDRSEDTRGGCSASFAIEGEVSGEEGMRLARERFPAVFERIEAHLGRGVTWKEWGPAVAKGVRHG